MANIIRVEQAEILAEAQKFREEGVQFEDSIRRMDALTAELTNVWEGDASVAYAEKYQALKPNLEECRNLIEQIAQALEKVVEKMNEMDVNIAKAFK